MDYSKLRGRIVEKYGTQESFAEAIDRSTVYVSMKLNDKTSFTKNAIDLWAKALDIPTAEIGTYFFTEKV